MKKITLLLFSLYVSFAMSAEIRGSLADAYNPKKPVAGQPVRLRIFKGRVENAGAEAYSDARGNYVFRNLSSEPVYSYIVSVEYFGVPYFKGPFQFSAKMDRISADPVLIYPSTAKLQNISMNQSVYLDVGRNDMMKVYQTIDIINSGKEAYAPASQDSELLTIPLAKGGFNVEFSNSAQSLFEVDEKAPALVFRAPIYPTINDRYQIKFSYMLPYHSRNVNLDFSSKATKNSFNILVNNAGVKVASEFLERGPDVPYQGKMSKIYSGGPIPAGTMLLVELRGLPRLQDDYQLGLILSGIIILVAAIVMFFKRGSVSVPTKASLVEHAMAALIKVEEDFKNKKCTQSDYDYETERLREIIFELKRT